MRKNGLLTLVQNVPDTGIWFPRHRLYGLLYCLLVLLSRTIYFVRNLCVGFQYLSSQRLTFLGSLSHARYIPRKIVVVYLPLKFHQRISRQVIFELFLNNCKGEENSYCSKKAKKPTNVNEGSIEVDIDGVWFHLLVIHILNYSK